MAEYAQPGWNDFNSERKLIIYVKDLHRRIHKLEEENKRNENLK